MYQEQNVAVVIPAFNEAHCIGQVVSDIVALQHNGQPLVDQIVVCDNASTDDTPSIAAEHGAMVTFEPTLGYGRACQTALREINNADVIIFVDGDHSVFSNEITHLLEAWVTGADLVIGSRSKGTAQRGALLPHQIIGNRMACVLASVWWQQTVTDLGPFRAIDVHALARLDMQDQAFGWTMEMQAKALAMGMRVAEVPVSTRRRIGISKVSGTLKGSFGAMCGIFGTMAKIAWRYRARQRPKLHNP